MVNDGVTFFYERRIKCDNGIQKAISEFVGTDKAETYIHAKNFL